MAIPMPARAIPEDLVRLRDEIAMQAMQAMVIKGGWTYTTPGGDQKTCSNMRDYSLAAYEFAEFMLAAREIK